MSTKDLVDKYNLGNVHNSTFIKYSTIDQPTSGYVRLKITVYEIDPEIVRRKVNTPPFFLTEPPKYIRMYLGNDPSTRIFKFYGAYDTFEQKIFYKTGGDFNDTIMEFDPIFNELKIS